ncbi:MAG TPA: hypothetical protein VFA38_00085 [Nitrospirales bacterium]|nr:hypothetical protein [Nitrospirales bacterium]
MAGLLSPGDVFEQIRNAAVAATSPDERALQVDYDQLKANIQQALGDRKIALLHINKFLPEGYEDQGRLNAVLLTAGKVVYDLVIGDTYFRYDVVSASDLDKIQLIDAVWENREKRQEEPFLSLRLMHGDEAHLLLALTDAERKSVLAFAQAVSVARHPEK